MIVSRVWHFAGEKFVPAKLREVPVELSSGDLAGLTLMFDVMLYRDEAGEVVLALDAPRGRFRQR